MGETKRELTAHDLCDRCGVPAFVRATVKGTHLLFCGHHFKRFEVRLRLAASEILDERCWIDTNYVPTAPVVEQEDPDEKEAEEVAA